MELRENKLILISLEGQICRLIKVSNKASEQLPKFNGSLKIGGKRYRRQSFPDFKQVLSLLAERFSYWIFKTAKY